MRLAVDASRVWAELETLAGFSDAPPPAVTRVLYTDTDLAARAYVRGLVEGAGLEAHEDGLGTLFARWEGEEPLLPAVATGSHIDAIPHAGRFDGTVGVLGGLEAMRALRGAGFRPRRSLELIVFTAEEPTRFGLGCLGSRAMSGALSPEGLRALRDADGRALEEVRREAGYAAPLEEVRLPEGRYAAFLELHIEQGPALERDGVPIGAVTAIAAPASFRLRLTGEGGHAGAVLMPSRRDALLAGAEVALAVERAALAGGPGTVGTVGVFNVHPGAINSIPSEAGLTIDVRDTDLGRRDGAVEAVRAAVEEVSSRRGVRARLETLNADPPATCAPEVVEAIESACHDAGLAVSRMVSRAYHDALFMARLAPTGMIFIPCRGGVSHRPDEYASPEAVSRGALVLARALARLSG